MRVSEDIRAEARRRAEEKDRERQIKKEMRKARESKHRADAYAVEVWQKVAITIALPLLAAGFMFLMAFIPIIGWILFLAAPLLTIQWIWWLWVPEIGREES